VPPTGRGQNLDDWSPDGRHLTFNADPDLKAVRVDGGAPFAFVQAAGKNVDESHFSAPGTLLRSPRIHSHAQPPMPVTTMEACDL
jgi:hypothetical protein